MKNAFQGKNIFKLKEVKEYAYLALFLIICSFLIVFVIKPNIRQIILAKNRVEQLRLIKEEFEKVINKIIEFQTNFEQFRNNYYLVDQAIPQSPAINKILLDVDSQVKKNNLQLEKMMINDINLLSDNQKEIESIKASLNIRGKFEDFNQLIKDLINQRRLKEIESFKIVKGEEYQSTNSGLLKIDLVINSYYW